MQCLGCFVFDELECLGVPIIELLDCFAGLKQRMPDMPKDELKRRFLRNDTFLAIASVDDCDHLRRRTAESPAPNIEIRAANS